MKLRHRIVFGMLVLGAASLSFSQEKKEPPQRDVKLTPSQPKEEEKTPLPKIENPEFVITGHETMDLPDAVKSDAADARSFVPPLPSAGAKASDVSRSATKKSIRPQAPQGMNGRVSGAFGNYITPSIGAWFGMTYPQGSMAVNGRFASSDGYSPNTQWLSAGFGIAATDKFEPSDGFFSESRWKTEFGIGTESYRAYGSAHPAQKRTQNDLDLALGVDSRYAIAHPSLSPVDYSTRVSWNRTSLSDTSSAVENDFGFTASTSSQYDSIPVNVAFEYRGAGESMPIPGIQAMHWLQLSGDAVLAALENLHFTFGAAVTMYRGNVGPFSVRIYPTVGARVFAADWLTLHAAFRPSVARQTFRQLQRTNRYAVAGSVLLPTDAPAAFSIGAELTPVERAAAAVNVEYKALNNYQSFAEAESSHVWAPVYISDIRALKADIRLRYSLTSLDAATGFITFNSVTHKDSSAMLPFIPEMNAGLIYRHWFQSDISAEISAEYVGRRFTDFGARNANAAYALVNLKAEYGIARNLRMTAEVQNLFDQKYYIWNGYRERPLFVSFGINYLW